MVRVESSGLFLVKFYNLIKSFYCPLADNLSVEGPFDSHLHLTVHSPTYFGQVLQFN